MKWELGAFFLLFMSKAVTINYFYFSIYNFLVFDLFLCYIIVIIYLVQKISQYLKGFSVKKIHSNFFFCFLTEKVISMKTKLQMQQSP